MRARLTGTWLALLVLTAPALAVADDLVGLQWTAPRTCPGADAVRARIERRLGAPVEGSVHGIAITVARENSEYVARIDMRGVTVANEMRTLTSARCDDLADAVAVVVARLATEARLAASAVSPGPTPEPAAGVELGVHQTIDRPRPLWGGGLRAQFLSGIGSVPRVGVGGELSAFARRNHWFAEVGGARWASSPKYLIMGVPNHVDIELTTLIVRAGWLPTHMPLRAWVGGEMGPMTARNIDAPDMRIARVASSRWVAAEAGFGVACPMAEHARIVGTFEIGVPIVRPELMLAEDGEIFRPYPTTARCSFGLKMGWR